MQKNLGKIILYGTLTIFIASLPYITHASGLLVPCGGPGEPQCEFLHLIVLANNIIAFLIKYLALPIAIVMFTYAGWLLMTSADSPGQRATAKKIILNVIFGLVIAVAAWVIIKTILTTLGYTGESLLY